MTTRPCLEPTCPNPATQRGRCPTHARQRNRETKSKNASIYNTKRWKLLRRHKLTLTPICQHPDCQAIAEHVHHIIDIQAGGNPWAMANLEALCASHHNTETRRRQTSPSQPWQ